MLLPAKYSPNWIRIKYLRWFGRNKEIIVTQDTNTSIIGVTLESRYSALVGLVCQQVNEGNGITTWSVERPQGQMLRH